MSMTSQNLHNIKQIFQDRTGAQLAHVRTPVRRSVLLAAVFACCALLAAFTFPLFTPLNGDALTLSGTYLGSGVVSVSVKNDSDRTLEFQPQLKLVSWTTGEEIPPLDGAPTFENTVFPPHSVGTMTIDLSDAYDVSSLETTIPGRPKDVYYYLLLTNRDFLFGHDWICSFSFGADGASPVVPSESAANTALEIAHTIDSIEEDLRFYFRRAYADVLPAFNEANFTYQQKVQELLMRSGKTLVRPVTPRLLVDTANSDILFDEALPPKLQYRLVGQNYHALDGYSRLVGTVFSGSDSDYALQLQAMLPRDPDETDGSVAMPLIYLFLYDAASVHADNACAFLYGQILPFSQLESCKVYEDGQYVIYNATHLFYTDLDAYIDYFLTTREDIYCDDRIRSRIHAIYDHYMDPDNLTFSYRAAQ